ncbi:MAG: hypothetical protein KF721_15875 [Ignavibacteriaceae bacterium]|nr:hypothetical protein [Ignavibacteriaceae bacterium]
MSKITLDIEPKPLEKIPVTNNKQIYLSQLGEKIEKPIPITELSFIEFIKAKYYHAKTEGEIKMWNTIKDFLVGKIVQWILKVGAGVLISLGISNQSVEEIIAAIVSLVLGIVYSLLTHKKIALTDPKVFMK